MPITSPPRLRLNTPVIRLQLLATSLALVALAVMAHGAGAHASMQNQSAQVGASYRGVMRIPHGCDGAPTLNVRTTIHFPRHQECEGRAVAWTGIPGPGQSARDPKSPTPALTLVAGPGTTTYKLGSLVIEAPWTRATPGGARVAGGYLKITNNGDQPDRLVGGSIAAAADVEVHEMALVDGLMKMRHLSMGLEIKPGETVELKPGSYHLMFLGLSAPLTAGQVHKGTLRFEKAGSVEVSFQVAPIGARSAGPGSHH